MSKADLQSMIKRRNGGVFAHNIRLGAAGYLLCEAFDLFTRYGIRTDLKAEIFRAMNISDGNERLKIGIVTAVELYNKGLLNMDTVECYKLWDKVYIFLNRLSPRGYYFGHTRPDESLRADFGWFKQLSLTPVNRNK